MVAKRARRRGAAVRSGAIANIRSGIAEKSMLFVVAGIAFLFLTALDRTKTRYDIRYDKNNAAAITVSDTFTSALAIPSARKDVSDWLNNPAYFKYHQFDSQKNFINALSARAAAEYAVAGTPLETEKRYLTKLRNEVETELDKADLDNRKREKKENELTEVNDKITEKEAELKALWEKFEDQSRFIHGTLATGLPQVMLKLGDHSPGMLDQLFRPILNEKNSLNVVFQVLRMTAQIIIVLTFIFIVVIGFQMLPLASGATTASEQLRSLISLKSVAAGSEVAKVAIIGITAVGLGTAVVVGGQALEGAGSAMVQTRYLPADSDGYRPSNKTEPAEVEHPIDFRPTINVPEPKVLDQRTFVGGDNTKVLAHLETLIKALPTASDVAVLKAEVNLLKNQKSTICDCLNQVRPNPDNDPITFPTYRVPLPTASPGGSPTPSPSPSPSPDNELVLTNTGPLVDAIGKLEMQLRLSQRPDDRNIFERTGDFIRGAEYFAVTKHSLDSIHYALGSIKFDPALDRALEAVMNLPPQRKAQFLASIEEHIRRTGSSPAALAQLKQYERKILIYFKLPN